MAWFYSGMVKQYNPVNIDNHLFCMNVRAPKCVPIVCSNLIADDGYGKVTVNGKEISKGKCIKFDFSPLPVLMLPVGEVATEFDKSYEVIMSGFRDVKGNRFRKKRFIMETCKRPNDLSHLENDNVAKRVSDEGIVLLKNEDFLPVKNNCCVSLYGDYRDFRMSPWGSSFVKPRWYKTVEEALEDKGMRVEQNSDTALFFISRGSGEGVDNRPVKGEYYLTDDEYTSLANLTEKKKVVLILNTGYPIEMLRISKMNIQAIIWTGFPGQRGTQSLADILVGDVCPSGRLADTWPFDYSDMPSAHNYVNQDEVFPIYSDDGKKWGTETFFEEKQFIGYRYNESFLYKPAFEFGEGLSYAKFKTNTKADFSNGILCVNTTVTNTVKVAGKESVLVYIQPPKGRLEKPKTCFVGFGKTKVLSENESYEMQINIPQKDFASFDDKMNAFILEAGEYKVFIGGSVSKKTEVFSFTINKEVVVEKTISVMEPLCEIEGISSEGDVKSKTRFCKKDELFRLRAEYKKLQCRELKKTNRKIQFDDVVREESLLDDFVAQMSLRELTDFTVLNGSLWKPHLSGAAGKLAHSKRLGIRTHYMSDGNNNVNLNKPTIGLPSSNVLAGTFNAELAYEAGRVIADESLENNISINLGPGGNLHRNFMCGRHPEYFSEDPILSGTMMAFQARGLEENGVCATYKHIFANTSELERKSAMAIIDARTIRELYLRVFDKAFSLYKPACLMTSYNPVNGIYPSECKRLLIDLIRKQWGFEGFIMTDWGSYDTADSIRMVNAGINVLTPGDKSYFKLINKAAKKGMIEKGVLQESVKCILKVLIKCETHNFK